MTFGASGSRFKWLKFLRNFGFGVVVGGIAVCVLGITLDARFSDFINHQIGAVTGALLTLIAGALALIGSLAAIDNQSAIEEARRNNRLAAERASLPMALSELAQISRNRVEYAFFGDHGDGFEKAPWRAAPGTTAILKACIEFTSDNKDPKVREAHRKLIDLIRFYQIVAARSDGRRWKNRIGDQGKEFHDRAYIVANWLAFQWLVEDLFNFARALTPEEEEGKQHSAFRAWVDLYPVNGQDLVNSNSNLIKYLHNVGQDPAAYFREL